MVICPAAVSLPSSRDAKVKKPPNSGDKSRETLPSSPMQKHTSFARVDAVDVKFKTARLSSIRFAVVTILHTEAPLAISLLRMLFSSEVLKVLVKSWKD